MQDFAFYLRQESAFPSLTIRNTWEYFTVGIAEHLWVHHLLY